MQIKFSDLGPAALIYTLLVLDRGASYSLIGSSLAQTSSNPWDNFNPTLPATVQTGYAEAHSFANAYFASSVNVLPVLGDFDNVEEVMDHWFPVSL